LLIACWNLLPQIRQSTLDDGIDQRIDDRRVELVMTSSGVPLGAHIADQTEM